MLKTPVHPLRAFLVICLLIWQTGVCGGVSVLDPNSMNSGELEVNRVCAGKIGECAETAAEEEMMESESSRRALAARRRYISYETLRRDLVPCDRPGASYYHCEGSGVANSYGRGCEMITRCARGG